jgi:tetratricopeptide (TPR) repeat protein
MRSADAPRTGTLHGPLALAAAAALLAGCTAIGRAPAEPAAPAPAAKAAAAPSPAAKAAPAPAAIAAPAAPAVGADAQRAFDAARAALAAGRTAEAERAFVALTKSHPDLAGPHANLGLIHRQAGRTKEAVAALEKAAALSPQRAELHNQLGVAYRAAGAFTAAKASYERSIALDAAYASAVLNLGILYDLYLWDGARALELYDRYLQLSPGDEQVKRWASDLRNRLAPKTAAPRKEQG